MGKLTLLSLPIGNMEDLTLRIKEVLFKETHFIVEDTGSPIISDPAYPLVKRCYEENISVETYPGPSSVIAGIELSGLPPFPFHFYGFFPRDQHDQINKLNNLSTLAGLHLFFESPHRIKESIPLIKKTIPHAKLVVIKELTKTFQARYDLSDENNWELVFNKIDNRGEFLILFYIEASSGVSPMMWNEIKSLAKVVMESKGKKKDLSKLLGEILEQSPKEIYQLLNGSSSDN
jgi:16S rRNA (cytidine1402-2'-O)-methyltransferase